MATNGSAAAIEQARTALEVACPYRGVVSVGAGLLAAQRITGPAPGRND